MGGLEDSSAKSAESFWQEHRGKSGTHPIFETITTYAGEIEIGA